MAPAGSFESLAAALQGGADSVYFGLGQLNMRSRATANFSEEDLPEIVARCHEAGAKAYLTLNIIVYEEELEAVQALPEKYRRAVYLRYYEEYTVEEIAALMGCAPRQVSTYLYRGKAKLKTMLGGSYGTECLSE